VIPTRSTESGASPPSVAVLSTRNSPLSRLPETWRPLDLDAILAGERVDAAPTVLSRRDGRYLFYAGKVHSVAGESESLKSWLLLVATAEQINYGKRVLWVDFEDNVASVVGRLRALGCQLQQIASCFRYVRPAEPLPAGLTAATLVANSGATLAVIDGVTEAMTLQGLEPLSNRDVATFMTAVPRPLADAGPAVVMIDHLTKSRENRGRFAIGAQHKLASLDGTAYLVELIQPFGHGRRGVATITVAKDRPGCVREYAVGNRIAELVLQSLPDGSVMAELAPPAGPVGEPFRPTVLMERVSRWLEQQAEACSTRQVEDAVSGKAAGIRQALAVLVEDGLIHRENGSRGTHLYRSLKAFRQGQT
jgi:hypothetical protein